MITFKKIKKIYHNDVINLLDQNISKYKPTKNYNKIYNRYNEQKNVFSLVALSNNKVIGYCSVFFQYNIRGGKIAYIEDLAVDTKFKKKGIGKEIVKKMIEKLKIKNCYKAVLQTRTIGFWDKMRFKKNGQTYQRYFKN